MRWVCSVLTLAIAMLVGNYACADEGKAVPDGVPHHPPAAGPMDMFRFEHMKGLNLTDEQKTKLEAVKKEYMSKFEEHKTKADKLHKEGDSLRKEVRGKIGEILTDEQKEKLKEVKKEFAKHRKGGRWAEKVEKVEKVEKIEKTN
jgi:Spy/CpxP family protein refolding chaperone